MAIADEFDTWTTWRGRRVRVTLDYGNGNGKLAQVVGVLLKITDDGEVDVRGDDGIVSYCWPCLAMELAE